MGVNPARPRCKDSSRLAVAHWAADLPRGTGTPQTPVGQELKVLRSMRGLSQMDVALSAGISARHLSFVETGRARPGRDVLLRIGEGLSLRREDLKVLLGLAGYESPQPSGRRPSSRELRPVLERVRAALAEVEPVPAVLADATWDLLVPNTAYVRLCARLAEKRVFPRGPLQVTDLPRPNLLLTLLDPQVRSALRNWEELAEALLRRIQRQREFTGDAGLEQLLAAARALPGGGALQVGQESNRRDAFPIRVDLEIDGAAVRCYSLVTCWATSLPGLRIELLHPVDEKSMRRLGVALGTSEGAWEAGRGGPETRPPVPPRSKEP
jgi:transcriptional regulator with XRE-family HTH domain